MPKKQKKKNDSKSKEESVNKSSNKENKNDIENSSQQNLENIEELKNKINLLEKKALDLEKKNIYYYNIIKKNENMYRNNFNDGSIEDFIEYKRYQNLNGYIH
jgi:hypothetical protein